MLSDVPQIVTVKLSEPPQRIGTTMIYRGTDVGFIITINSKWM